MAKYKVYELAKELDKSSKEVLSFLQENGVEAKAAQSSVDDVAAEMVRKHFGVSAQPVKAVEETKAEAPKAVEEAKAETPKAVVAKTEEAKALNDQAYKTIKERGLTKITELTPQQIQAFRDILQPVYDEFEKQIGTDVYEAVRAANEEFGNSN